MTDLQEGLEGRGTLPEENADIFQRVLEFIYTGEYDPAPGETEDVAGDDIDKSGSQDAPEIDDEAEASRHQSEPLLVVPETNEDETEASRQQSEQLMIHTGVYLLAKFLDIGDLMQHAISKFRNLVKENFRADAFVEPFAQVFNHGTDGEGGLRSQILELCLENSEHLSQEGELTLLLLQHEPIAWRMLLRQANEHTHQVEGAAELERVLKDTLQTSQETIKSLEQRVEEMTMDRDRILALLEKYDTCRHCERDFGSYIDTHERGIMRDLQMSALRGEI